MSKFAELTSTQKEELATSLAVLTCYDTESEVSAANLTAVLEASGNKVSTYLPGLFADLLARGLKIEDMLAGPSAGGSSGGAAAAGGAAAPAAEAVKEESEEEEADLGGGMDMFGGGADY